MKPLAVGSDFEQDFKLDYSRPDVILVHIPIINDDIFELDEEMKVHLSIVEPIPSNVEISTSETTVTIVDDDSKCTANNNVTYSIEAISLYDTCFLVCMFVCFY